MVQMVVSDKDGLERIETEAPLYQVFLESPQAYTGIDDYPVCPVMKEIAIPVTTAGETHEPQHQFFSSSQYLEMTL